MLSALGFLGSVAVCILSIQMYSVVWFYSFAPPERRYPAYWALVFIGVAASSLAFAVFCLWKLWTAR